MKTASVLLATVIAVPFLGAAPAHAEVTWKGCDTDRFVATAKYKANKLKIIQRAQGCMEWHTMADGTTCGVLTRYTTSQAVQVEKNRKIKVKRAWNPVGTELTDRVNTGCNIFGDNTGVVKVTQKFKGQYYIPARLKTDPMALPGLTVMISANNPDTESIVQMTKTGSWKFATKNNKAKKTKPNRTKRNRSKNPKLPRVLPPAKQLPIPGSGSPMTEMG